MSLQLGGSLRKSLLFSEWKISRGFDSRTVFFAACADWLAVAVAASLPWSTSATSILVALWLASFLPTLELPALRGELLTSAGGLPFLLWLLAAIGMTWAGVS